MIRSPLKLIRTEQDEAPSPRSGEVRLAYDPAAFDGRGPSQALRSQFPQVVFASLEGEWATSSLRGADVLIAYVDGADAAAVERVCENLRGGSASRVIVFLAAADVATTRRILREGVADVLPTPVTDPALAVSLERVIARIEAAPVDHGRSCRVVSFLKAGGGVGATALTVQTAALLAQSGRGPRVCVVDLDVQFGQAALYLDVRNSTTMSQALSTSGDLSEVSFGSALTPHSTGVRVLAAPSEFMSLDAVTPAAVDGLITALKREFDVILIDLPSAWTAWTYRALRQSDQIVLVTSLSVPHAHLTRRQLGLIDTQRLGDIELTLVCNRCGGDNPPAVPVKSVEAAIGRSFDVSAPEERKLMNEAINQGFALAAVRRGSKLERALQQLADRIVPARAAQARRGR